MKTIAILLHPGFQLMSLAASAVFEMANRQTGEPAYRVVLVSEHGGPVASSLGFAQDTIGLGRRTFDTLIVAGDNTAEGASDSLLRALRGASGRVRRCASMCTGAFVLAQAGLLDGRRATTHWFYARRLQREYPRVKVDEDRIFVADGPIWTSAGMSAGIDLALAMVEADLGAETARAVARKLVLTQRRAGGQSQYSALLELDAKSDRVQTALAYAKANLKAELSVEDLARAAHLSPRQFSRVFRQETGQSPAKAVEHLRLEAAQDMMQSGRHAAEVVARETGFGDRDRMRKAFLRAFGQSPQAMRRLLHA
ncbi:MAG: GlxA family transcriptional regulator [Achromobacter xylosoxidans]|nr:GlxA family transcriptional regulator [Achromobacter xylosoxidans]